MPKKIGEAVDPLDLTLSDAADMGYQPEQRIVPTLSSIRVLGDGSMTIGGFTFTRTGLQIQAGVKDTDWKKVGGVITDLGKSIQWILGDWLAYGDDQGYKPSYDEVSKDTGYELQSLRDLVYVCRNVPISVRTDTLKFGHHKLVAALAPHQQVEWLQWAATANDGQPASIAQMREEMKGEKPTPLSSSLGINPRLEKKYHEFQRMIHDAKADEIEQIKVMLRYLLDEAERRG